MKTGKCLLISVIFIAAVIPFGCAKTSDGNYKMIEGDCSRYLTIKNVGEGRHLIIMKGDKEDEFELLGNMINSRITASINGSQMQFSFEGGKITLTGEDKSCIYIKID
jgi:hypothetical protein